MGGARVRSLGGVSARMRVGGSVSVLLAGLALAGAQPAAAVLGGSQASITDAPWQVEMATLASSGVRYCGGVILSERLVLTAAHCVANSLFTSVVAGDSKYNVEGSAQQAAGSRTYEATPSSVLRVALSQVPTTLQCSNWKPR